MDWDRELMLATFPLEARTMKGIWQNGYTADHDFHGSQLKDLAKEMKQLADKLEGMPWPGDARFDEIIEENVEAALKEYAASAFAWMSDTPGVFEIHLWCDWSKDTIAKIPVDIREELNELASSLGEGQIDEEEIENKRRRARAWADVLEALVRDFVVANV